MDFNQLAYRQRGVALLMAVVAVAFIAILAVAMLSEQNQLLRRVSNNIQGQSALEFAKSGEQLAAAILQKDFTLGKSMQRDFDFDEPFLRQEFIFPIEDTGGMIAGSMDELNGLFNVNNLVDDNGKTNPIALASFKKLLQALNLPVELGDYLADWLDSDDKAADGSLESNYYQNLAKPYLSANQPLISLRELGQVRGFDEVMYDEYGNPSTALKVIKPYLIALPTGSSLNVNTADAKIMAAYMPELEQTKIDELIKARPFFALQDFEKNPNSQVIDKKDGKSKALDYKKILPLSVGSEYFGVDVVVEIGRIKTPLYSIIKRSNQTGRAHLVLRIKGKI